MGLPEHLRQIAASVARHEMGHYVIARALGFMTGDVILEIREPVGHRGAAEIILQASIKSLEDVRLYLERRVIVLYAGALAETLPYIASPTKRVDIKRALEILNTNGQGAEQDYAKVRELIHALRNISHPDTDLADDGAIQADLYEVNDKLFYRAVELVETLAETITGLGQNLADRVEEIGKVVKLEAVYLEDLPCMKTIEMATP